MHILATIFLSFAGLVTIKTSLCWHVYGSKLYDCMHFIFALTSSHGRLDRIFFCCFRLICEFPKWSHVTYPIMDLMLPVCSPDSNWWVWLDAAAYILLPQCIMGKVTWDPPEYYGIELERLTDRQTGLKTLLSHKLCMWAIIKKLKFKICCLWKIAIRRCFFSWKPEIKVQRVMYEIYWKLHV